jgi:hypothetical protein
MNMFALRGELEQTRVIRNLKDTLEFCPVGRNMEYITDSDFLMEQWNDLN